MKALLDKLTENTEPPVGQRHGSPYPAMIAAATLVVIMLCSAGFTVWNLHQRAILARALAPMWHDFRARLDEFGRDQPWRRDDVVAGAQRTFQSLLIWFASVATWAEFHHEC